MNIMSGVVTGGLTGKSGTVGYLRANGQKRGQMQKPRISVGVARR